MSSSPVFSASYDRTTKILTAGLICMMAVIPALLTQQWWIARILVLSLGLSYGFSVTGYSVEGREIRVHRPINDKLISLEDVQQARLAKPSDLRGTIRLMGNGGVFGYYGVFRTSALGVCRWYVTNRSNAVVVTAGGRTFLFSPDDREGFLSAIRAVTHVRETPLVQSTTQQATGLSGVRHVWIGLGIGAFSLAIVAAALLYSPGPPRYTLTHESLSIHDRFYPVTLRSMAVDVDNVRTIDLEVDKEWRTTLRTNGFSNTHYHSGWYRVVGGQSVRMYRADGNRLVLLPSKGKGAPVLLEVTDPGQFIRQLRDEWR